MSSEFMRKTADVLEKMAAYLDEEETQHQVGVRAERQKLAEALGEKIATATGEDIPAEVLKRIIDSDKDVLDAFTKLAGRTPQSGAPEELGEAGDMGDNNVAYRSDTEMTKEAAAAGEQQFLDWIMS